MARRGHVIAARVQKPSADLVSTLVVLIDHSTPEWMIAETARIPGTVVDHIGIM
jgi:hypothetical protein